MRTILIGFFLLLTIFNTTFAKDGHQLWLQYDRVDDAVYVDKCHGAISSIHLNGSSEIITAIQEELELALPKMLGFTPSFSSDAASASLIISKFENNTIDTSNDRKAVKAEGFLIKKEGEKLYVLANDDRGLLYGTFRLLQLIQKKTNLEKLHIADNPKTKVRILNHWDNLDRTVERGYAGFSIWDWHQLPEFIDDRYKAYARANASVGINGTVVTNVNANALVFRDDYLDKAAALANVMRPYGIKLYLTARFSSPIELGGLPTADPLDPKVIKWWKSKVDDIYEKIPDFGGFLVKANSEGQPGPNEYGRTHAEGANMMANALAPHGGIVMWRAFVYSELDADDRAKQAYTEFKALDGKFKDNVIIQVKNGPIDFQPREPIHPLFGALQETAVMMELQITKEYLGQGTHLVGLASMWEEIFKTDTYTQGKGSTVSNVIQGTYSENKLTGVAGVSNIGTARNWTGNFFGQCDWYAFGRLAWNPSLSASQIFDEWTALTFSTSKSKTKETIKDIVESSYETCVQYMTPLGLHHIMAVNHHYGPGPWVDHLSRPEWNSVYYHNADSEGVGFERGPQGSNAIQQYAPQLRKEYYDETNMKHLLWFHHVGWNETLSTGNSLWDELCIQYQLGVDQVHEMKEKWTALKCEVDSDIHNHVLMHLDIQAKEAIWWKDACLSYFQTYSKMDFPNGVEKPQHDLSYYKNINYPYAPGIRPQW